MRHLRAGTVRLGHSTADEKGAILASTYFLKLDGIQGESLDRKHKDEIELVGFSWGVTETGGGSGAGGGAGKPLFSGFHVVMRVSKASPQLFLTTASGKHIKEANLTARAAGKAQLEFLKIKFTDVLITEFSESAGTEQLQESVSFNFAKIEIEYTPQNPKRGPGSVVRAGWDLKKNVKI